VINDEKFNKYKELLECNMYDMIQLEDHCIVSRMPNMIKRNDQHALHCTNGPAITFVDGYSQYYINGRNIDEATYMKALNNTLTKDEWMAEKNEDIKATWFEVLGSEKVMTLLGAVEIDTIMITHSNGEFEDLRLYKTPFDLPELDEPLAWVKFICPSTSTNYMISVNPKFNKVMDAVLDTCPFYGQEIKENSDYDFNARG